MERWLHTFYLIPVVDCQVTSWGPWSTCDTDCGPGSMSRTRSVKIQPQNGGRHCPSLEQRRGCQVSTCHHHPDPAIKGKKEIHCLSFEYSAKSDHCDTSRQHVLLLSHFRP